VGIERIQLGKRLGNRRFCKSMDQMSMCLVHELYDERLGLELLPLLFASFHR
jgi:hypothetical protein